MKNEEKTPIGTTMVYFVREDWKSSENKAIIQPFSLVCYYLISRIMWGEKKETFGSEMALLAELAYNSQTFSMLYVFFLLFFTPLSNMNELRRILYNMFQLGNTEKLLAWNTDENCGEWKLFGYFQSTIFQLALWDDALNLNACEYIHFQSQERNFTESDAP